MARIVLADDGIVFDGRSPEAGPLGGVESAVVYLARALARRGHDMSVHNKCARPETVDSVRWVPLAEGLPGAADLYIANRGDKLLPLMPAAARTVFWVHNPASYLLKWRYLSKLWLLKPTIVFIGDYHATTYPAWAPGGARRVIPYGIDDQFRAATLGSSVPGPRAIFTSNPLRGLDWLLDLWTDAIRPAVPGAELRLFAGAATYGATGAKKAGEMAAVLDKARSLASQGVIVRPPVAKPALIDELRAARVMLYKGDANETFCLAVGEAQATGVPAVVQRLGSVVERVVDGRTGAITDDDQGFAAAAVRLLTDDDLWRRQHEAAAAMQRDWGWDEAAAAFEELLPE